MLRDRRDQREALALLAKLLRPLVDDDVASIVVHHMDEQHPKGALKALHEADRDVERVAIPDDADMLASAMPRHVVGLPLRARVDLAEQLTNEVGLGLADRAVANQLADDIADGRLLVLVAVTDLLVGLLRDVPSLLQPSLAQDALRLELARARETESLGLGTRAAEEAIDPHLDLGRAVLPHADVAVRVGVIEDRSRECVRIAANHADAPVRVLAELRAGMAGHMAVEVSLRLRLQPARLDRIEVVLEDGDEFIVLGADRGGAVCVGASGHVDLHQ